MDKALASSAIIAHALPHVPFEGWSRCALEIAAVEAGYQRADVIRVFPGGAIDAVDSWLAHADQELEILLQAYNLESMRIRERITTAVRLRITIYEGQREALRKAIALQALPYHMHHALRSLYRTVDAIWHAIGDHPVDFSFYTKRLTLAAVYSATLLYWLEDASPGHNNTWAFLDRRIENVMAFEKAKYKVRTWLKHLPAR